MVPNVEFVLGLTGATAAALIMGILPAGSFLVAAAPALTQTRLGSGFSSGMPSLGGFVGWSTMHTSVLVELLRLWLHMHLAEVTLGDRGTAGWSAMGPAGPACTLSAQAAGQQAPACCMPGIAAQEWQCPGL